MAVKPSSNNRFGRGSLVSDIAGVSTTSSKKRNSTEEILKRQQEAARKIAQEQEKLLAQTQAEYTENATDTAVEDTVVKTTATTENNVSQNETAKLDAANSDPKLDTEKQTFQNSSDDFAEKNIEISKQTDTISQKKEENAKMESNDEPVKEPEMEQKTFQAFTSDTNELKQDVSSVQSSSTSSKKEPVFMEPSNSMERKSVTNAEQFLQNTATTSNSSEVNSGFPNSAVYSNQPQTISVNQSYNAPENVSSKNESKITQEISPSNYGQNAIQMDFMNQLSFNNENENSSHFSVSKEHAEKTSEDIYSDNLNQSRNNQNSVYERYNSQGTITNDTNSSYFMENRNNSVLQTNNSSAYPQNEINNTIKNSYETNAAIQTYGFQNNGRTNTPYNQYGYQNPSFHPYEANENVAANSYGKNFYEENNNTYPATNSIYQNQPNYNNQVSYSAPYTTNTFGPYNQDAALTYPDINSQDVQTAELHKTTNYAIFEDYPDINVRLPLKTNGDREMLKKSILESGIADPIIVAPVYDVIKAFRDVHYPVPNYPENVQFIIIAGQNRRSLARELNIELPFLVKRGLNKEQMDTIGLDTNLLNRQFSAMKPSEQVYIVNRRRALFEQNNTRNIRGKLSEITGYEKTYIYQLLSLVNIKKELLTDFVDKGYISVSGITHLVSVPYENQTILYNYLVRNDVRKLMASQMKALLQDTSTPWTDSYLNNVLFPNTKKYSNITIRPDQYQNYIPEEDIPRATEIILTALKEYYQKRN